MKTSTTSIILLFITITVFAQNPKKTYDYQVFGERVAQAIFTDLNSPIYSSGRIKLSDAMAGRNSIIGHLMDNKAMDDISAVMGKSVDELSELRKTRKNELEYELTFLKMKYSNGIIDWDKAQLDNVKIVEKSGEKLPVADIFLDISQGKRNVQIVLENCIQTNTEWVLGDFVGASGSRDLIH